MKTPVTPVVYDQLERIALGMKGRQATGFRENELDPGYPWTGGKQDWRLIQELDAELPTTERLRLGDMFERLALGVHGRRQTGFRENERDPHYWGSGKPDWQLAQELLATIEKEAVR